MRDEIYETLVLSHLIGRYEMMRYARKKGKTQFADDDLFDLPDILKKALDWFSKRKVITKLKFMKLSAEARWQSFTIARVSDKKVLDDIKTKLTDALKSGITIDDFRMDIDKTFDAVGVTKLNPFHLDTVFLTNAMTGYGEGRKQVIDDLSDDEFPYRQVVTVGDDRVRDAHAEIDGYVADKNDSVWTWLKTPFSYRCRCGIWTVHKSEGLTPSGYIPNVRGKQGFEFLN